MKSTCSSLSQFLFILFFLSYSFINAQEDSEIPNAYEEYTGATREVVYLHINKSTYIKGESIGFTAYVIDKKDKQPSLLTTNLYVSIEDEDKNVLKQKMIKVNDGVASNAFEIDSLFSSGYHNIKAYTNWMLNFNEQNHFVESIRIIDPNTEKYIEEQIIDNSIDAQFLPESGHILHGVLNTMGVVIKDSKGYGVPNAKGEVIDNNNKLLSSFETNQFGIGKFPLFAEKDLTYKIRIKNANKNFNFSLNQKIERNGIILSVKRLKTKTFVSAITNNETLESIKNKRFTLMVHNGDDYDIMDIYFTDNTAVTKVIESNNIPGGINILTLFNENNRAIAERLFFNYEDIEVLSSNNISSVQKNDSLIVNINYKQLDARKINNLSVSVLPKETESYNRHHNIISYTYLQPYVKGTIENSKYYFTDIDEKKRYELDNLLITQGWSSYNWDTIFKNEYNQVFAFEQGLTLKANINLEPIENPTSYLLHGTQNQQPLLVDVSDNQKTFSLNNIFYSENDKILISQIKKNSDLKPAQLYIQSFPNIFPSINNHIKILKPKTMYNVEAQLKNPILIETGGKIHKLKKVVINAKYENKRIRTEELAKSAPWSDIYVIDEDERIGFNTLTQFINTRTSLRAYDDDSLGLVAINPVPSTINNDSSITFFLNGVPLNNNNILYRYSMFDIDYIEINKWGIGEGIRGGNGVIKIYTNPDRTNLKNKKKTYQEFKLPLVFSEKKSFYVPKYINYKNDFFKNYGTIDWKPELILDTNGNVSFKIKRPQVPFKLFIEGTATDGSFIFEEKSISLN